MDVSLLIRLIDQASAPAKKIADSLRGIGDVAGEMKRGFGEAIRHGFSVENIETATKNAEAALQQARSRLVGAIGMGIALAAPVIKAADFQAAFIDFANVAEIPIERMAEIEARLIAATRVTGKNKSELLDILSAYVGKGMSVDDSLKAIEATGRAATATKSEVSDMTNAGFAVMDNLKVSALDLAKAFDVMAASGKEGSFELKDMSRNFPELTANAAALEMKGVPAVAALAAALQMAMKSAGSADQAANNMSNFLGKITSPETVRNFKKFGIDIEKELKKASDSGTDPLLHALKLINQATGGNQFKMGELFADKQVLDFLRALLPNLEEYERIRDKAAASEGIIDKDWINVTSGLKEQFKGLATEVDNMFSAGSALLPIVQGLVEWMTQAVRRVNDWMAANAQLTETIVKGAAGLLAMNVASRVLAFGLAAVRLPLIKTAAAFLKFDKDGRNIATGWRLLAATARVLSGAVLGIVRLVPALRNAGIGFSVLSTVARGGFLATAFTAIATAAAATGSALAAITAPVWVVVGVLVAAGAAVWKYWDRVSSFASGFASVFGSLFSDIGAKALDLVNTFVDFHAKLFGVPAAKVAAFKASIAKAFDFSGLVDGAKAKISELWEWLTGQFTQEKLSSAEQAEMYAAGQRLAQSLIDGIKSLIDNVRDLFKFALEIEWPEPPAWLKWLMEKGGAAAEAASSGTNKAYNSAREWYEGVGGNQTTSSASAGGSVLSGIWTDVQGLFSGASDAGNDLASGGQAVARGGQQAESALQRGADAINTAFAGLPGMIQRAVSSAGAGQKGARVAAAISASKNGTLTDGGGGF
mgnify:CR=1 FL=1